MQLIVVFQILLLVAIAAGIFVSWDGRAEEDPAGQISRPPSRSR